MPAPHERMDVRRDLAEVFEDKEESRKKLSLLWEENSKLEGRVRGNKAEDLRLEVLVRNNREELSHLEDQLKESRAKIKKASEENEAFDRRVEQVVREGEELSVKEMKERDVRGRGKKAIREEMDKSPAFLLKEKKVIDSASMRRELELNIVRCRKRIEEGSRNLSAHEEQLVRMVEMRQTGKICQEKAQEVEKFKEIHRKCIEMLSGKIESYQARIRQLPHNSAEHITKDVSSTSTSHVHNRPGHSRKIEVVEVIEEKKRKMIVKEQERIVPRVFKVDTDPESSDDEESYPAYGCSHCPRHLTSAATLVSHMEKHFPPPSLLPCPFPRCSFSSNVEGLTRHARSKHTGEKLFPCSKCTSRLPSYVALRDHEKKHTSQEFKQCRTCLRFHKVNTGAGCHFCKK